MLRHASYGHSLLNGMQELWPLHILLHILMGNGMGLGAIANANAIACACTTFWPEMRP